MSEGLMEAGRGRARAVVLLWFLAACGRGEPADSPRSPGPTARGLEKAIAATATEVVIGVVDDWTSTKVSLRRFRRRAGSPWTLEGPAWPGVVGKHGLAWGSGLHGDGAPRGHDGPIKREGDGKSPAGVFSIGEAFGYAASAPAGSPRRYTAVDPRWKCVDDPASSHYNQILDERTTSVDWKSAEEMKRADALYTWVVELGHNRSRAASSGSCIFLHVWSGPDAATLGCTAMPETVLAELIATLDASAVFVLLPVAEYTALAGSWGLPPP